MPILEIALIQVRRGQERETGVPQLNPGEFGWAEDTQNLYIGKRISEGANNDENSRILTDKDLNNIFDLIGFGGNPAVASTSTYRYRDDLPYEQFASTTTSIAKKLDNWVSLTDFTQFNLRDDITEVLQTAVNDLYANSYFTTSTIRALKIPAGTFTIDNIIDLPPFANLIGEGAGITTLVLTDDSTGMFRTVDALGANYAQGMQYDGKASKEVHLSNMTLAYKKGNTNNNPLINLDNTENPVLENLYFTTQNANVSTSTFVSTGTAISMRGSIGVDESTTICRNININNCQFENINTAIVAAGRVSKSSIDNNLFTNIRQGIILSSTSTTSAIPTNFVVSKNEFKFVIGSAISITTNTHRTNLISTENKYFYVGNGSGIADQNVASTGTAVLTFNSPGNMSVNDYFNRKEIASTAPYNFYYNTLVSGNARVNSASTYNTTILPNSVDQSVVMIPLTTGDQLGIIDYQLSNNDMSRKGRLTLNISPDGYASVSDYYNYSEFEVSTGTASPSSLLIFSTDMSNSPYGAVGANQNYIKVTCSSFTTATTQLEFNIDLTV